MPGETIPWPAWQEFTYDNATADAYQKDPDFERVKREIAEEYGEEALRTSWLKTCAALEKVTEEIELKGRRIIPILDMEDVSNGHISGDMREEIKRIGCFIVRGVIDPAQMAKLYQDLKRYVSTNEGRFTAWPEGSPSIFNLYNTPTQNALRTHPNQVKLMRWINELWHWSEAGTDTSPDPLLYADGVRVRPAKQAFLGLGPHIDAGSLCRWADPSYREVYAAIFSGEPERHDVFDLDTRKDANQALFSGDAHSTVMRSFQGWTAITKTAPREGTIMLYPNVKSVIAYVLLRPFFQPPDDDSKIMDASQWTYDPAGSWFPGTFKPNSQLLSPSSHPHLRLKDCLIHIPPIDSGDTVWWHTDMCHAVDAEHLGEGDASVAYIAATPTTQINKEYMQKQYRQMVAGRPPPDFSEIGVDESTLEGFEGFAVQPDLFKKLMGY